MDDEYTEENPGPDAQLSGTPPYEMTKRISRRDEKKLVRDLGVPELRHELEAQDDVRGTDDSEINE
jgi:hypothetical protein